MFNSGYKKEALAELERWAKKHDIKYNETIKVTENLHEKKQIAVETIRKAEEYMSSLANLPIEFEKSMSKIRVLRQGFEDEVRDLKNKSEKDDKINKHATGAGVAAGVGVAAFGPTAAMAIATTFGTASTGTAIATLSGAAATNAALAWLGGGALVAGGGGIAAGEAFLAMAGPVGWAIGGAALVGGGLMANNKNKKIAEEARGKTEKIKVEINELKGIDEKVNREVGVIQQLYTKVDLLLDRLNLVLYRDYDLFTDEEKDMLGLLKNLTETLSERVGAKIK